MLSRAIQPKRRGRRPLTALADGQRGRRPARRERDGPRRPRRLPVRADTSGCTTAQRRATLRPTPRTAWPVAPTTGRTSTSRTGGGSAGFDRASTAFITDPVSSAENSFYTGGGSKDVRDIPAGQYANTNDVVPDKDDLAHAFAAAYTDPADDHTHHLLRGRPLRQQRRRRDRLLVLPGPRSSLGANGALQRRPHASATSSSWPTGAARTRSAQSRSTSGSAARTRSSSSPTARPARLRHGRRQRQRLRGRQPRTIDNPPWPFLDKGGSTDIRPLELFEAGIDLNALFGDDAASPRSSRRPARRTRRPPSSRTSRSAASSSAVPRSRSRPTRQRSRR